jgi:hypothetical protein
MARGTSDEELVHMAMISKVISIDQGMRSKLELTVPDISHLAECVAQDGAQWSVEFQTDGPVVQPPKRCLNYLDQPALRSPNDISLIPFPRAWAKLSDSPFV